MQTKINGLVISEKIVKENNRLINILTPEGVMSCFVNCSKNLKNGKTAATQLFAYSDFVIYKNKEKSIVDEVNLRELFWGLRSNIEKLSLAQYFCELALSLVPEYADSLPTLRLMLNSFHYMCEDKMDLSLIKSIVEMRLVSLSGYMPNVVGCTVCGEYDNEVMYFYPKYGIICCGNCYKESKHAIKIRRGTLACIRHIIYSETNKLFNFDLSDAGKRELSHITEKYILERIDKSFKTLEFYHQISR